MRVLVVLFLATVVAGCSGEQPSVVTVHAAATGPFQQLSVAEACERASREGKLVLIDFFTTWCSPCKKLDVTTWRDARVVALLGEKFVALKLDAEKDVALASRYEIVSYPTILLLRPDGSEIDRMIGYCDATTFLANISDTLGGGTALTRAKAKATKAGAKDPSARMDLARQLAARGKFEESLGHYLWCWEHGAEVAPSWVGVRGSFLLSEIKALATKHEPARTAMLERRDRLAAQILGGKPDRFAVDDFGSLSRNFADSTYTLGVFDKLVKRGEAALDTRSVLLRHVIDDLLAAKRYVDIMGCAKDLSQELTVEIQRYRSVAKAVPDAARSFKAHLLERAGRWFEVMHGVGKHDEAGRYLERLLRFDASADTIRMLADHAERAGQPAVATQVRQRLR